MAHSAIDWDFAPDSTQDEDNLVPIVLPVRRPRTNRRVGIIKWFSAPKAFGLVVSPTDPCEATFNLEDVRPSDRPKLNLGQAVTFEVVNGPDGHTAKRIRIDATTLPPPPSGDFLSKGWR